MKYKPQEVVYSDAPVPYNQQHPSGYVYKGTLYPPEVNPLEERVYPAPKTRRWKVAPKYGKSFKKVKQLREIKMTPYSVGMISETWSLAEIPRFRTNVYWPTSYSCHKGQSVVLGGNIVPLSTHYIDRYDIIRAADSFPAVEYTEYPTPESIAERLNDLKAGVVQDSYSGFDLLTEMAEFPETLGLLVAAFKAALRPLQGIKKLKEAYEKSRRRGSTHTEAHSEIRSQWMQYRYGIMPLVYTIQDLVKLLDEGFAEFKTDRDFSVLTSKPKPNASTESHIAIYRSHDVRINVVGKAKFGSHKLRMSDLITTNLFVTAWELIPMSFVIDWFINVGDVIAAHTVGIGPDFSEERKFCYSIKRTTVDKHVLNYNFTDGTTKKIKVGADPCGTGPIKVLDEVWSNESINMGSVVLYERREESYERFPFHPNSIELSFSPSLNWMRALDGYVLSFNQISKTLKKLR